MIRRFVRALIRNAVVTEGGGVSLRVDPVLLNAAGLLPFEEVELVNAAARTRVTTFVEAGGAGEVRVPGMRAGDVVSVIAYGLLHDGQTLNHKVKVVTCDGENRVIALAEA
ncbi:MAG TPA: aspartate 1-decarboxylase [Thermoanaerobaculia bacterium]|jgi:aspartate 1-decarboxylase